MSNPHFQLDPTHVKTEVEVLDTSNDKPIEAMADNFEELALEDEELPLLTESQEVELVSAIVNDVDAERMQNAAHYGSLADAVPIDDMPISPHGLFEDMYEGLDNPMPMTDDKGVPLDQGRRASGPPIIGTQADRDQVDKFIRGETKKLTRMQQAILFMKLEQEGTLEAAVNGKSGSPALNSFFNDLKRMQKQNPVVFGRPVHVKQRTSKTRDKGKKKAKKR
jgi:hypothetical protein